MHACMYTHVLTLHSVGGGICGDISAASAALVAESDWAGIWVSGRRRRWWHPAIGMLAPWRPSPPPGWARGSGNAGARSGDGWGDGRRHQYRHLAGRKWRRRYQHQHPADHWRWWTVAILSACGGTSSISIRPIIGGGGRTAAAVDGGRCTVAAMVGAMVGAMYYARLTRSKTFAAMMRDYHGDAFVGKPMLPSHQPAVVSTSTSVSIQWAMPEGRWYQYQYPAGQRRRWTVDGAQWCQHQHKHQYVGWFCQCQYQHQYQNSACRSVQYQSAAAVVSTSTSVSIQCAAVPVEQLGRSLAAVASVSACGATSSISIPPIIGGGGISIGMRCYQ